MSKKTEDSMVSDEVYQRVSEGIQERPCGGSNGVPPFKYMSKSSLPAPVNVTLFGNPVFADPVKLQILR